MQFRLLGSVDVLDGDRAVGITARRERAVLLRLLLEPGRPIDPDRIVDDVWGDDAPADGRGSLRVLVARLRKKLEAADEARIVTGSAGYELRLSVDDEVDAARFDALVGRARDDLADGRPAAAAERLRNALDLWRGPALGDLADLDFARPEAVRLEEGRFAALEARVEADLARGRHAELVGELEALCAAHPLRETLWAHRMVALYRSGRQADALRTYQDLRRVLAEEVGLEPTPALVRLEAAVLAGDLPEVRSTTPPAPATVPVGTTRDDRPLVGRDEELALLEATWAKAATGERRAVLLAGEPGAGKTRLAEELAHRVAQHGGLVLDGRFDEEGLLPYQGFLEALRRLQQARPDLAGSAWSAVAPLLPGGAAEPVAAGGHGTAELERYRLLSAVETLLDDAARSAPTLLLLDDLQWADAPSLLLLKQLVRSRTPSALLVVATYRSTELDDEHPLVPVLAQLHRARNVEEVGVGALDVADLTRLVELRLGVGPDEAEAIAAVVAERTSGHALFSEALVEAMCDPRLDPVSRQVLDVPTTVREFVATSVGRLSRWARSVLAVAATCGTIAPVRTVLAASGLDREHVLDGIEECTRSRMLLDDDPTALRFSHALVRDVVYASLPAVRRADLHQAVADALEGDPGHATDERSAEVVHHLALAPDGPGNLRRRIDHARTAAAARLASLAYEAAAELLLHALEAHARLDAPAAERAELLVLAARPLLLTGRASAATAACTEALDLAAAGGDALLAARAALVLEEAGWTGYGFMQAHEAVSVAAVLRRGLEALDGSRDAAAPSLRAELLARLPRVLHFGTAPAERLPPAEEALRQADELGDARLRGAALEGMRWALWGGTDIERLAAVSEQIVPEAQAAGDRALEVRGQVWRYLARLDRGDLPGVREAVADLRALGTELPEPLALWYPEVADTAVALLAGHVDDAEQLAFGHLGVARRFDLGWAIESFGIQLQQIRREQCRLSELEDATLAVAAAHEDEPVWQLAVADLHLQLGRRDAAAGILREVVRAVPGLAQDLTWLAAVALAADLCLELADAPGAAELYPVLLPSADRVVVLGPGLACLGSAARPLGGLAGLLGETDVALEHLAAAEQVDADLGATPALARTHLARAAVHARRGETAPAAAARACAQELAATVAIPLLLVECERAAASP